jgi:hypothetical protein
LATLNEPGHLLEAGKRLSESLLWRLQKSFFAATGATAWSRGIVPHYVTSNGWIAGAYARVVLGWLRDVTAAGLLDPRHPVYLMELGCGSGRFGYCFLARLLDLVGRSSLRGVTLRYVLSDFTESNLAPLRSHPSLQPWIAEGIVDFACFDAAADGEIRLERSGVILGPGTLANPLIVIANYVFDGVPQDAFAVRAGRISELLATLTLPEEETDLDEPTILQRVDLTWEERPLPNGASGSYYGDPELDALLADCARPLKDTALLFPLAALGCLRHLAEIAGGRLLLLSGDKGYCLPELLDGRDEPGLTVHGSVSLMVNYHVLGRWFAERGGEFLASTHLYSSLNVVAGVLGGPPAVETALAFDAAIERQGPDDFFDLKVSFGKPAEDLPLEQLVAWLRLSGWDANVLLDLWPALMKGAAEASGLLRLEIYRAVHQVWDAYFPLQEARDLAFHLGVLLCEIECHGDALPFFHASAAVYGANPATVFNIGLCLYHLGDLEAAREALDEALREAPDLAPAVELRREVGEGLAKARTKRAKRKTR